MLPNIRERGGGKRIEKEGELEPRTNDVIQPLLGGQ
jgi:hypothetical protein